MATILFHGSLNDFVRKAKRGTRISIEVIERNAIKDSIEALSVPHPEIAAIKVNGSWVDFSYILRPDDAVEVFPAKAEIEVPEENKLQPPLPKEIRFVPDVHLGKLAKNLRMLGFDTVYENNFHDQEIAWLAALEHRIVLTRDVDLLKQKVIKWGYWLRSQHLEEQLTEVIRYFDLEAKILPFTRCLECNGLIYAVRKEKIWEELPPNTRLFFNEFYQCGNCRKVYWKGSHYERMEEFVRQFQK